MIVVKKLDFLRRLFKNFYFSVKNLIARDMNLFLVQISVPCLDLKFFPSRI